MKFMLEITLNKTTMKTGHNIAAALIDLARLLLTRGTITRATSGEILDADGQEVGNWRVTR